MQRAIADACLGADAEERIVLDLPGWLASHGVALEDIEAIRAAPPRLSVHRCLVRNGLSSVVLAMLPRTRTRMNAQCGSRFDADLAAFLDQVGPHTHYLRDVPAELFAWAEPHWRSDSRVPPYLPDLAAHELAHFAVGASESARAVQRVGDVALDRPLAFIESARIVRYSWAVHELSADHDATDEPPQRDVCLLAYRDAVHSVRWLDIPPLAGTLLDLLLAGETLGAAVQRACVGGGATPSNVVVTAFARLLADLGDRGVLV